MSAQLSSEKGDVFPAVGAVALSPASARKQEAAGLEPAQVDGEDWLQGSSAPGSLGTPIQGVTPTTSALIKHFSYIITFDPHDNSVRRIPSSSPFCR